MHGVNISRLINFILIINNASALFGQVWQNRFNEFDSYDHMIFEEYNIDMEEFLEEIVFDCHGL